MKTNIETLVNNTFLGDMDYYLDYSDEAYEMMTGIFNEDDDYSSNGNFSWESVEKNGEKETFNYNVKISRNKYIPGFGKGHNFVFNVTFERNREYENPEINSIMVDGVPCDISQINIEQICEFFTDRIADGFGPDSSGYGGSSFMQELINRGLVKINNGVITVFA